MIGCFAGKPRIQTGARFRNATYILYKHFDSSRPYRNCDRPNSGAASISPTEYHAGRYAGISSSIPSTGPNPKPPTASPSATPAKSRKSNPAAASPALSSATAAARSAGPATAGGHLAENSAAAESAAPTAAEDPAADTKRAAHSGCSRSSADRAASRNSHATQRLTPTRSAGPARDSRSSRTGTDTAETAGATGHNSAMTPSLDSLQKGDSRSAITDRRKLYSDESTTEPSTRPPRTLSKVISLAPVSDANAAR